jgi:hypothetical protein
MAMTEVQDDSLIIIERTSASVSVFAALILIASYQFLKVFQTHSNKLLFFASFANIFAGVAALIGGTGLTKPNGALCQFQGFLLEMFVLLSSPLTSTDRSIGLCNLTLCGHSLWL